ncbi:MAG: AbrB/MazE/SpoVT family DNA-binding domain-containing protein [Spirochaetia bacterium]|nr:AbrB/MazE/SpoVT family DNA-binding domain-containing protein [Spirochaetia bacterium]
MSTVTISSKYQIVIPKSIRDKSDFYPGQKVELINYDGRIEIIPLKNIKSLRGIAKGINTEIKREEDRF